MDLPASSKSEMAYQFLLKQLIEAKIPPEAPLRIPSLGKDSGLGVTPMREALRRLESERFVVMENNRGFRAAAVTQAELMDLEGCRLVIETALLREAIAHGDDVWEAEILSSHHLLAKAVEPAETSNLDDLRLWSDRHRGFHRALLVASRSQWLNLFYDQISNHLDRHFFSMFTGDNRSKFLRSPELISHSRAALGITHHTKLMEAVLARDEDRAVRLLEEHAGFTRRFFDRVEDQSESSP
ncbi:FCD domain-containing protein [Phaeobacter italicus]|uniref:GntR family transcriptional regulator n=1 Tax=Phaeobacter italicus TaxID=481446 RepID=UPI001ADC3D86|nr:FCD domain-containing protein [Phaeobacter italicus]MEC8017074.1 FCD domain-containing protein [Pseudomonadota bacterium]MBO9443852.1 FCD domain-containing protein [Phaeobacter italicus]MBY5978577.1 FCD domain-containing protein [Phaeobacter italicus]MCA0858864.1 FCD domain-containing protein [Phaeobacter italicus]MEC8575411.1 FCD domain-containing protein [Pseudomonadota bacterium]